MALPVRHGGLLPLRRRPPEVLARAALVLAFATVPALTQESPAPPPTQVLQLMAPCAGTDAFAPHLSDRWHEKPAGEGLADFPAGIIAKVWVSPERTWTVTATLPNGQTCIVAAGRSWRGIAPAAGQRTAFEP
jgi:hypothetical protein